MPASPFDSAIYRDFWQDAETARLFTDSSEVRAMLLVWGALAKAQAAHGMIPETAAQAIQRGALEAQIDPSALAAETGRSGVVVPALVKAFRAEIPGPEHRQYLHWGATSQDIMETGLVLRMRRALDLWEERLRDTLRALATLARDHAETPMAGRTYGQVASPTSFGAVAAEWGGPLLRHLDRLEELRPRLLYVSLSGAAGTLSVMGDDGPAIRAAMAKALDLGDPGSSWHSARDRLAELAGWITLVTGSLGKMGEDMVLMTQSGQSELRLGETGGSSTMPQKQNPVQPSQLVALAHHAAALNAAMQGALIHRQQRDGAAWFTEWLSFSPMLHAAGRATALAQGLAASVSPDIAAMRTPLDEGPGLIHAEALSFALAAQMPRPDAQAALKSYCATAMERGTPLADLLAADYPGTDWSAIARPEAQLGCAPAQARDFAETVVSRLNVSKA